MERFSCPYMKTIELEYDVTSGHAYEEAVCSLDENKNQKCFLYHWFNPPGTKYCKYKDLDEKKTKE